MSHFSVVSTRTTACCHAICAYTLFRRLLAKLCLHRFQPMLTQHQISTWICRHPICGYDLLRFGGYRIISTLSHQPCMGKDGETTQCLPQTALLGAVSIHTPSKAEVKGTFHNSARLHNLVVDFQPGISDSGVPAAFLQSKIIRRSGIPCCSVSKIYEYQTRTRKRTTSATTPLQINSMRGPLSMSKIASVGGCPMH